MHLPVLSDLVPDHLHHGPPHIIGLSQLVEAALRVMKPIQQHLEYFVLGAKFIIRVQYGEIQ